MTEEEFRCRPSADLPPVFTPPARSPEAFSLRPSLETRLVALAVSVGVCTSDAREQMPALPVAVVRRCFDAALELAHACRLLVEALGLEEMAADERAILATFPGATIDHPDHREQEEEP